MLSLQTPFPIQSADLLWSWLQESPDSNLDDYGPQTAEECARELAVRNKREITWMVKQDGAPVGFIGFAPFNARHGSLHGVCFTQSACGTGAARIALAWVITYLFSTGIEKISASYFADNLRVDRFLRKLGFQEEGLMRKQTLRRGQPVDMRVLALFEEDLCRSVVS